MSPPPASPSMAATQTPVPRRADPARTLRETREHALVVRREVRGRLLRVRLISAVGVQERSVEGEDAAGVHFACASKQDSSSFMDGGGGTRTTEKDVEATEEGMEATERDEAVGETCTGNCAWDLTCVAGGRDSGRCRGVSEEQEGDGDAVAGLAGDQHLAEPAGGYQAPRVKAAREHGQRVNRDGDAEQMDLVHGVKKSCIPRDSI
ncbi:hypothetical protein B0H10DRAFT_1947580 [Mycena sp. CBHHK59/15]|nr:hypothetical protein B0H10DRAFT_1947580 [Mycena sp. CBHHK59/15]